MFRNFEEVPAEVMSLKYKATRALSNEMINALAKKILKLSGVDQLTCLVQTKQPLM